MEDIFAVVRRIKNGDYDSKEATWSSGVGVHPCIGHYFMYELGPWSIRLTGEHRIADLSDKGWYLGGPKIDTRLWEIMAFCSTSVYPQFSIEPIQFWSILGHKFKVRTKDKVLKTALQNVEQIDSYYQVAYTPLNYVTGIQENEGFKVLSNFSTERNHLQIVTNGIEMMERVVQVLGSLQDSLSIRRH